MHTCCSVDVKNHHVEWDFELDKCMFLGQYEIEGQVLILPIKGEGDANITVSKCHLCWSYYRVNYFSIYCIGLKLITLYTDGITFTYIYDYELIKRANQKDYVEITNSKLKFNANGMKLKLDNLFNGDKLLGKRAHILLKFSEYLYKYKGVYGLEMFISTAVFLVQDNNVLAKFSFPLLLYVSEPDWKNILRNLDDSCSVYQTGVCRIKRIVINGFSVTKFDKITWWNRWVICFIVSS